MLAVKEVTIKCFYCKGLITLEKPFGAFNVCTKCQAILKLDRTKILCPGCGTVTILKKRCKPCFVTIVDSARSFFDEELFFSFPDVLKSHYLLQTLIMTLRNTHTGEIAELTSCLTNDQVKAEMIERMDFGDSCMNCYNTCLCNSDRPHLCLYCIATKTEVVTYGAYKEACGFCVKKMVMDG